MTNQDEEVLSVSNGFTDTLVDENIPKKRKASGITG